MMMSFLPSEGDQLAVETRASSVTALGESVLRQYFQYFFKFNDIGGHTIKCDNS